MVSNEKNHRRFIVLCFSFHRCGETESTVHDASLDNMACEDINDPSWSGVIMKSACNLLDNQTDPKGCQTIQQLNMTLQQELPAFD